MEPKIRRKYKTFSVTIGTSASASSAIRWDDAAGGALILGTGATSATTIQLWASGSETGQYGKVYDASGTLATITLAQSTAQPSIYQIPDAAFASGAIKLVAAEAAVTSVSSSVMLKS